MSRREKPLPLSETMPKGISEAASWRLWIKTLRERCPTRFPVVVRRRPLISDAERGYCVFDEDRKRFTITIRQQLHRSVARDTLIHEWAHACAWFKKGHDEEPHGRAWAIEFGRCYQATVEI